MAGARAVSAVHKHVQPACIANNRSRVLFAVRNFVQMAALATSSLVKHTENSCKVGYKPMLSSTPTTATLNSASGISPAASTIASNAHLQTEIGNVVKTAVRYDTTGRTQLCTPFSVAAVKVTYCTALHVKLQACTQPGKQANRNIKRPAQDLLWAAAEGTGMTVSPFHADHCQTRHCNCNVVAPAFKALG